MSEQSNSSEVVEKFSHLKQVLLESAHKINTLETSGVLPPVFLADIDFMVEFSQKVNGLIHPAVTEKSPIAHALFEKMGKVVTGFKGKSASSVESQIKAYYAGQASKSFLKTVIAAEERSFKADPSSFQSYVDNSSMLDIIFSDEALKKTFDNSLLPIALSLQCLSKEEQEKVRMNLIQSGRLKQLVDGPNTVYLSGTNALSQVLKRWNLPLLSSKVLEELLSHSTTWNYSARMLEIIAENAGEKHFTKSFTKNFVKAGIAQVGMSILKSVPKSAVQSIVKELFDAVVLVDKSIEEKIKADSVLTFDTILDDDENHVAAESAYVLIKKLSKEFKGTVAERLVTIISEEFNGYNYSTFTDEVSKIATEESDYVEVFKLAFKHDPAYVLQEMCKTHQDSLTRNLVVYALGDVIDNWYEDSGYTPEKNLFEAIINQISHAQDFTKIDTNIFSDFASSDWFSRALSSVEKRWCQKHKAQKDAFNALTSWQKVQVLSRFFILEVCEANYDPNILLEEGLNVKGNRQVRSYLPNPVNWALFELKEHAKDLDWTALTTKKAVTVNGTEVKFSKIASKYFQATQCKNYNPYSGFDVGAYEELCKAEKCAPYGDSAKSKALMYLTYLLGKNIATAQSLIAKAQNLNINWEKIPTNLTAEEKASVVRLLTESGQMWGMLHLFKDVVSKAGVDVTFSEFDKLSVMHYYSGVTEDNYNIAYQLKKWNFDSYVFDDCRDFKPKKKSNIPLHEKKYNDKYLAHVLKPGDARALVMGEESGCCQSVDNAASECAEAAYIQENSGIFAIDGEDGKLISQSFIWLSRDSKYLIVDSIETIHQLSASTPYTKLIAEAYLDLAREMNKKNIQVVMSASNYNNAGSRVYEYIEKMFSKEMKKTSNSYYSDYDDNEYVYSQHFSAKDNFDYSDLSDRVVNLSKLVKEKKVANKNAIRA